MKTPLKPVTILFAGGGESELPCDPKAGNNPSLLSSYSDIKAVVANLGYARDCNFTARRTGRTQLSKFDIEHLADAVKECQSPWVIVVSDTKHMAHDSRLLEMELKSHLTETKKIVIMTGSPISLSEKEVTGLLSEEDQARWVSAPTTDGYENLKSALQNKSGRSPGMYVVTNRGEWMTPQETPQTIASRVSLGLHKLRNRPGWSPTVLGLESPARSHAEEVAEPRTSNALPGRGR